MPEKKKAKRLKEYKVTVSVDLVAPFGTIVGTQTVKRETILKDFVEFWAENGEEHKPEDVCDDQLSMFFGELVLDYGDTVREDLYIKQAPMTYTGNIEAFKEKLFLDYMARQLIRYADSEKVYEDTTGGE